MGKSTGKNILSGGIVMKFKFVISLVPLIFVSLNLFAISVEDGFNASVSNRILDMTVQIDGKIVIGGIFTSVNGVSRKYIARLNMNGSLDTTFVPDVDLFVRALEIQPDKKIIIGGDFSTVGGVSRNYLARLNSDGTLDTTFNISVSGTVRTIKYLTGGKILIGGDFSTVGGVQRTRIARLNSDGSLDTTFVPPSIGNSVFAIETLSDGSIIVAGSYSIVNSITTGSVIKLNPDGSLNTNFLPKVATSVYDLAVQPDDKILIAGDFTSINNISYGRIARLNPDGSVDSTFNASADATINSIKLRPDGKILLGGAFSNINNITFTKFAILNPNGEPTVSYWGGADGDIYAIALQRDKKVILGGNFTKIGNISKTRIARFNPDLSLENTFNSSPDSYVYAISMMNNYYILIGGSFNSVDGKNITKLAKFTPDAKLNETMKYGINDTINSIATPNDNSIIIGGLFTSVSAFTKYYIAKLAFSLIPSFNPNPNAPIYAMAIYHSLDEQILIGGDFTNLNGENRTRYAMLFQDGSTVSYSSTNPNGRVNTIAVAQENPSDNPHLIIGGDFTQIEGKNIARLAKLSFWGAVVNYFQPNPNDSVKAIAVQPDGKILVGGKFTTIAGTGIKYLARLNNDGTLDSAFNPGPNGPINTISLQANGDIIIGGSFTTIGSTPIKYLARLNKSGGVDNTFDLNLNNEVYGTIIQPDGKILIGGAFTASGSTTRNYIARIDNSLPATESIIISSGYDTIKLIRSYAKPEASFVKVMKSTDGINWENSGLATRISSGWEYNVTTHPYNQISYIKFLSHIIGGVNNSSSYFEESTYQLYLKGYSFQLNIEGDGETIFQAYYNSDLIHYKDYTSESFSIELPYNATIVLMPRGKTGTHIDRWEGDCPPCNPSTCSYTLDSNKVCKLIFKPDEFDVTVTATGEGSGQVASDPQGINFLYPATQSQTIKYEYGTNLTLTAQADTGSSVSWSICNGTSTGNNTSYATCTISGINSAISAEATFSLNKYLISTNVTPAEGGDINCDPNPVSYGKDSQCTITPSEGYYIEDINSDCNGTLNNNIYSLQSIKSDCNVEVKFSNLYQLNISKSGTGSGNVISNLEGINCGDKCSEKFTYNTQISITATPDLNSEFVGWEGDCTFCASNQLCELTINTDKDCTAVFELKEQPDAGLVDTSSDVYEDISDISPDVISDIKDVISDATSDTSDKDAGKDADAIIIKPDKGTEENTGEAESSGCGCSILE